MPPPHQPQVPKKSSGAPEVFTKKELTSEERALVEMYMHSLPKAFIDPEAESHSINMTLLSVCQNLATKGHFNFSQLDLADP